MACHKAFVYDINLRLAMCTSDPCIFILNQNYQLIINFQKVNYLKKFNLYQP